MAVDRQQDPNADLRKRFGTMTPEALSVLVDGASARAQTLDTSGTKKIGNEDLDRLRIAELGLAAKVSSAQSQGAGLSKRVAAEDPSANMGRRIAGAAGWSILASAAAAATGLPSLGYLGMAMDARRVLRAAGPSQHSSAQNTHFHPVAQKTSDGYFGRSATSKGTHHVGGVGVATATPSGSFADYTDRVRGVGSPKLGATAFGSSAGRQRVPNIFEEKFAGMKITDGQHESNVKNLAAVRSKIDDVQGLISGHRQMDAKHDGVMAESAWHRMDNGHKRAVVRAGGLMTLGQTGRVDPDAMARFAVGSFEPRPAQQMALSAVGPAPAPA